jgi:AcrR family transcriptional regulator
MARPETSSAVEERPGLRERKAAATRIAIAEALYTRLASTALADISVEQLAEDANVSRMTFFNYFPTKEHAVDLIMVRWMLQIEEGIATRRLRGLAAIEQVFVSASEEVASSPDRMRRMVGFFASRPHDRPPPELGRAARLVLATTAQGREREPRPLGALFMALVDEAKEDGAGLVGSSYEVAHFLGALLNGSFLIGHSSSDTDWKRLYRRHVRRALGLLGAKGMTDPLPPRVPARWKKGGTR